MKNISIYLAGPIDGIAEEDAKTWREQAGLDLPTGVLLFSPAHAYFGASLATARELACLNGTMLMACDAMIANLSGSGMGFGTIREIQLARMQNLPVAVVYPEPLPSLMAFDVMRGADFDECLEMVLDTVQAKRSAPPVHPILGPMRQFRIEPVDEEEDS